MKKKYVLTEETMNYRGYTLHRIKAIKDFENIKAGDLGGWIESEENLSHEGLCWVGDEAKVYGKANVSRDAWVYRRAEVCGNARIGGRAMIFGDALVFGNAQIFGDAKVSENAHIFGNAQIFGDAAACRDARIFGDARVGEIARLRYNAYIHSAKDYLCVGPIGSRDDFTTFYKTGDQGIWVACGCFNGSIECFKETVNSEHRGTIYEKEYLNAIVFAVSTLGIE